MQNLTPEVYDRLDNLGEILREKLRAIFAEFEIPAQVTGVASLFGVHFTTNEITDYRSSLNQDSQLTKGMFTGMLNEGVLMMGSMSGALNTLTTETDVDTMVGTARNVIQRLR